MTDRMSREQYKAQQQAPKKRKYRNVPVTVDGLRFDSKREAAYYGELKIREKAGEVSALALQPSFELLNDGGKKTRYVADFAFWDHVADRFRIVDVKGFETRIFQMKKRMMKVLKGIDVEVIK